MAGFGAGILPDLDRVLPAGSLVIVEDPDVVVARNVRERMSAFGCVADLIEAPVQDEPSAEKLAEELELPSTVVAIVPGVEYGVVAAAAIAAELGRPGAGVAAARLLRDKVALRTAAGRAGLAQPAWREVTSAADVRRFGHPSCVLKPANLQASVGVQLLGPGDDIDAAWARTAAADEPLMRAPGAVAPRFLVEARMAGPEFSVEALVRRGEVLFANVTAKSVLAGRHPVELGHVVPAPLPSELSARFDAAIVAFVAATGFDSGTLHSEWIVVDGQPHLVECAGRLPGDDIVPLIDLAYGGSLVADLLTVLSGDRPHRTITAGRGAAVRFLTASAGKISRIDGTGEAAALDGVVDVRVTATVGARVNPLTSSWDRLGRVIATGDTGPGAAAVALRAIELIQLTTTPDPPVVVTDPRRKPGWWPAAPGDPRAGLAWAAGGSDAVAFLGRSGGPALWLRESASAEQSTAEGPSRMDPLAVVSGATAGQEVAAGRLAAIRAGYPRLLVSAANGYGSPVVAANRPDPGELAELVAALVDQAGRRDAVPVVLHCPAGDPLLEALVGSGFVVGMTDLYPVLELPGHSVDDYLAALSKRKRTNVRREIAQRVAGSTSIHVGEQARPHLSAAAALNASAYRQRGEPGDEDRTLAIYRRLLDTCGDAVLLTLIHSGHRPVASAYLVAGTSDLLLYSAGLVQPDSREVAGYFNAAYYLPIEYAYEHGLRRLLLGPTGWQTKRLRGAELHPLYSAVPAHATALVDLLRTTDTWIRSTLDSLGG